MKTGLFLFGMSDIPIRSGGFFCTFFSKNDIQVICGNAVFVTIPTDSCPCSFTGKDPRKGWRTPFINNQCSEQRDEETGYSYHGARYYDPETSGLWLSVDPMADKYPGFSPYAYCAWNSVKLFDPNGLDTFNYDLQSGNMISYIIEQEGKHCINFYVGDNLVGSCGELGGFISTEQSTWNIDDVQGSTDYLIFTDGESGKKVFDLISSLAKDADTRSDVEWDYYLLKNGSGELSTSHQKDMMVHDPNKYIKGKASSWDHYHPFINSYSWFPGNSPQISFGPNDRTTMDLKGQQGVNDARQMAIDNIKNGNFDIVSKSWQYGQDQFYEGIKEGNVVTSFLGSYNTTVSISPGNNEGEYILNFEVNNTSSWESATRLRRDHDGNGNHDAIIPSKARGAGIKLGGNFRQTWRWSETINVQ